uniref:Ovule protein n=1 Tax=Loa loa TaxID=7209 RepID=A0A1I7V8W1_LOALO
MYKEGRVAEEKDGAQRVLWTRVLYNSVYKQRSPASTASQPSSSLSPLAPVIPVAIPKIHRAAVPVILTMFLYPRCYYEYFNSVDPRSEVSSTILEDLIYYPCYRILSSF